MGTILFVITFSALFLLAQNDLFKPIPIICLGLGLWAVTSLISIYYRRSNGWIPDNLFQHFLLGVYWQSLLCGIWFMYSEGRYLASIASLLIAFLCIDFAGSIRNIRSGIRGNRILPRGVGTIKNLITGKSERTIRPEIARLHEDH